MLERATRDNPDGRALFFRQGSRWETMSFHDLLERCHRYTGFLREQGLERGQRALMMVPNGPDFVALTFAVFRVGALPVLIDPAHGSRSFGVTHFLRAQGLDAYNLIGGITQWHIQGGEVEVRTSH